MPTYEVEVITRVREIYVVEAESEDEARDTWHDYDVASSEFIEVEDIGQVQEIEA